MKRRGAPAVLVRAGRGMARHVPFVRRTARAALLGLEVGACELSIALVDDREMQALNRAWRGKDRPTDVLAFPQQEGESLAAADPVAMLGDVVVSLPTAERQASARRLPLESELATLLVHGILHLLGFDHERSPAEARRMFRRQREILAGLPEPARPRAVPPAGSRRRRTGATGARRSLAPRSAAR